MYKKEWKGKQNIEGQQLLLVWKKMFIWTFMNSQQGRNIIGCAHWTNYVNGGVQNTLVCNELKQ